MRGSCPKTLFFFGNSMTIKFGNFANDIVKEKLLSFRRLLLSLTMRQENAVSPKTPQQNGNTLPWVLNLRLKNAVISLTQYRSPCSIVLRLRSSLRTSVAVATEGARTLWKQERCN